MGNITKELQKLLKDYNKKVLQSVPTMARQIATDAEPEYRKIINESINQYYATHKGDFSEGRLENMTGNISAEGSSIIFEDTEENVPNYHGFWGQELTNEGVFDLMYLKGEHGNGKWHLVDTTPPPFDYVEQELVNGRLDKIIDNSVHKVLDKIEL